jgi:hypothetical protein
MWSPNFYFYFLKIQKKKYIFLKKIKKNVATPLAPGVAAQGVTRPPHGAKGVAETTPKPPLGVAQFLQPPQFFFFFFLNKKFN